MKKILKKTILLFFALNLCSILMAQDSSAVRIASASGANSVGYSDILSEAYNAYRDGDYQSALFLFKRVLSDRKNQNDNTLYMLVMSGMNCGEYKTAYGDAEYFLASYPQSDYVPIIKYQIGRALFYLEDYDKALVVLGDFCHEYPDNMMYASALFLIGECFYVGYNFEQAAPFYERIINEFPESSKVVEAQYRLDSINARRREQMLLYMLQETGENYLSSKEDYEKTLRRYELENSLGAKNRVSNSVQDSSKGSDSEIYVFEDGKEGAAKTASQIQDDAAQPLQKTFDSNSEYLPEQNIDAELFRLKASALEAEILINNEREKEK